MAKLGRSAGRENAGMGRAIEDTAAGRPTYPSGTTFIDADIDGFGECVADEAREGRPIVIVYPDGEERFLTPSPHPAASTARLARLRRRLTRRR